MFSRRRMRCSRSSRGEQCEAEESDNIVISRQFKTRTDELRLHRVASLFMTEHRVAHVRFPVQMSRSLRAAALRSRVMIRGFAREAQHACACSTRTRERKSIHALPKGLSNVARYIGAFYRCTTRAGLSNVRHAGRYISVFIVSYH